MKLHLRRITGQVRLTFEELQTVLCQIEACLNSRPLIQVNPTDCDVIDVLTPAHFLVGQSLVTLPDHPNDIDRPINLVCQWQSCQNIVHHFWKRWSKEYVSSLMKYIKDTNRSRNINIGDIVVLRDDVLFPISWPLARVIKVHLGKDNLVRVATVKTAKGIYKRHITKLVLLKIKSTDTYSLSI